MKEPIHERVQSIRRRANDARTVEDLRACVMDLCDAVSETLPKMADYFGEQPTGSRAGT